MGGGDCQDFSEKWGEAPYRGLSIEGELKPSAHYEISAKADLGPYETTDAEFFEGIVNGVELLRLQKPEIQMLNMVLNTPLV